jgi:hypothetical protein
MKKIQLKNVPNQKFKVVLDGQNCQVKLYYRFGSMYLDLSCNDVQIISGAICRNRAGIVTKATNDFKGQLHFVDLLGENDPQWQGFGNRFSLLFVSASEPTPRVLLY